MQLRMIFCSILAFFTLWQPRAIAEETDAARAKAIAEAAKSTADAAKSSAEGNRIGLMASTEVRKLEADVVRTIAEAYKFVSESHLNYARIQQITFEIERLKQRMRITEYEFDRIARADYKMAWDIAVVEGNVQLVRPLISGHANWRTWLGLEALMVSTGDADIISKVMFDVPVPALPSGDFRTGSITDLPAAFPGGNLGELYNFAREHDFSFKPFGLAHKNIMKIVAMISTAAEIRIRELRDINQAVRLTIARID